MSSKLSIQKVRRQFLCTFSICVVTIAGCKAGAPERSTTANAEPVKTEAQPAKLQVPDDALPPEKTGGFDGAKAYEHVAKQVSFGPRPAGSQQILQMQDYVTS